MADISIVYTNKTVLIDATLLSTTTLPSFPSPLHTPSTVFTQQRTSCRWNWTLHRPTRSWRGATDPPGYGRTCCGTVSEIWPPSATRTSSSTPSASFCWSFGHKSSHWNDFDEHRKFLSHYPLIELERGQDHLTICRSFGSAHKLFQLFAHKHSTLELSISSPSNAYILSTKLIHSWLPLYPLNEGSPINYSLRIVGEYLGLLLIARPPGFTASTVMPPNRTACTTNCHTLGRW